MEDNRNYPKVLLISHNAFSLVSNNGKTFSSIFSGWPKSKIAQLYFHNDCPDFSICNNFFKMTDKSMIFRRKEDIGEKISVNYEPQKEQKNNRVYNHIRKKRLQVFLFLRNIIWSSQKWNNKKLYEWLDEFSPEAIFLVGGGSIFPYEIANEISYKYSAPIYLYYTDDYITPRPTLNLFWWLNWIWLKKSLKDTLERVNKVFVIGEDMANEYSNIFGKPCIPIMNAIDIEKYTLFNRSSERKIKSANQLSIAYFGGLHLNRWKTLSVVGDAIKELSEDNNVDIRLSIYSSQRPDEQVINAITNIPYIQFIGSLNEDEIVKKMQEYDILIHIESFDRKIKHMTRLSISTKIPEYLASGKPILAVGPEDISSIRYLQKLNTSYIINSLDKAIIKKTLIKVLNERDMHKTIGLRNIEVAKANHSMERNRELIKENLSNVTHISIL